jgi:peptidoglycan hydrolase-like protein with peptidoglycan-binding domain
MRRGTKITTAVLGVAATVALGAGAAFGGLQLPDLGVTEKHRTVSPQVTVPQQRTPAEDATTEEPPADPADDATEEPVEEPAEDTAPAPLLQQGDHGRKVRELQHRLHQLAWYPPTTSGRYDKVTTQAVRGFQRKRGLDATGDVDRRTWRRLVDMTRTPTGDELFNRSGPSLFSVGDSGPGVREIQARLRQIGWFFGDVTDSYGDRTTTAVKGFQAKRMIPVTGAVDQRTLDLLEGMTREPTADELANRPPDPAEGAALDPRCTTGRALCIDKSSRSLRWVVDGKVLKTVDVRFGAEYSPTREGQFRVEWKSADHVSSLYGSAMPFSMFFSRGQAVHYSSDFAARGYAGASHGCVNVRDYSSLAWIFAQVRVGDKVVVYWS